MRKIFLLSVCVLCAALFVAGCATKNNSENATQGQAPGQNGRFQNASGTPQMNFGAEINMSELAVGKIVTIFGAANSDGTVSASRILLGEMSMMQGAASGTPKKFTKTTVDDSASGGGSASFQGGGEGMRPPSDGEFQFRERPDAASNSGDTTQTQQRTRPMSDSIIVGEILSIDENSLTLKIKDGGSKIIYFTVNTKVYLAPTSTPMTAPPPTSTLIE